MPAADAGVGLPRLGRGSRRAQPRSTSSTMRAAASRRASFRTARRRASPCQSTACVVIMRGGLEPVLAEGKPGIVEIEEVGLVILDHLLLAQQPLLDEPRICRRRGLDPLTVALVVPRRHRFGERDAVGRTRNRGRCRVPADRGLPRTCPRRAACAANKRRSGGRASALRHRSHRRLVPVPCVARMVGDAEFQSGLAHQRLPSADDVLLRPDAVQFHSWCLLAKVSKLSWWQPMAMK